jgi:hypothetical protein
MIHIFTRDSDQLACEHPFHPRACQTTTSVHLIPIEYVHLLISRGREETGVYEERGARVSERERGRKENGERGLNRTAAPSHPLYLSHLSHLCPSWRDLHIRPFQDGKRFGGNESDRARERGK